MICAFHCLACASAVGGIFLIISYFCYLLLHSPLTVSLYMYILYYFSVYCTLLTFACGSKNYNEPANRLLMFRYNIEISSKTSRGASIVLKNDICRYR